jgi:3-deoxy-D-manno-octulosonic-acid transferase
MSVPLSVYFRGPEPEPAPYNKPAFGLLPRSTERRAPGLSAPLVAGRATRMFFLYSLLTGAAMLVASPYFLFQALGRGQSFGSLRQRFGWGYPAELRAGAAGAIWLHAVSVGELLAVLPLLQALKERFPQRRLVVSTTTGTGQHLARERLNWADAVFYYPLDWDGPVRRALDAVRPSLVVIAETEIWPNFLRAASERGVPIAFVNGRLSERSYKRLKRAASISPRAFGGFERRVLSFASVFMMQSDADAERLRALGAPPERIVVSGNLKYDLAQPNPGALAGWLAREFARISRGPVLVAGSLAEGEERPVIEALGLIEREWPAAMLILAPRKPQHFDSIAREIETRGRTVLRRSALDLERPGDGAGLSAPGTVLLLDSVGELAALYVLADVAFVGGSLVPAGGHNILEPAIAGRVPVFGPSMENFREIAARFRDAGAGIEVADGAELAAAWSGLLRDCDERERRGAAAKALVERHRGATLAAVGQLSALLESSSGARGTP